MSEYGSLHIDDDRLVLRFERRFSQPIDRVWRAVTDPDEMKAWFPSNVEGERTVGAELVFSYDVVDQTDPELPDPENLPLFGGEVLRFDAPHLFEFTWGGEILRLELSEDGEGTRLVFSQILSHRATAGRNGSGWHACLAALAVHLGEEVPEVDGFALYDDYVVRIGIPLGTTNDDGSMIWELATHVETEQVDQVISGIEDWVGTAVEDELRWEVDPVAHGSVVRITHDRIGRDPHLAAIWHARMIQLDRYLAARIFHAVSSDPWVGPYAELFGV